MSKPSENLATIAQLFWYGTALVSAVILSLAAALWSCPKASITRREKIRAEKRK
jgi:hypothetical protein